MVIVRAEQIVGELVQQGGHKLPIRPEGAQVVCTQSDIDAVSLIGVVA
jgi:hypothetical protein